MQPFREAEYFVILDESAQWEDVGTGALAGNQQICECAYMHAFESSIDAVVHSDAKVCMIGRALHTYVSENSRGM